MAFTQKPLTGALFRNKNKKSAKHADYNGRFTNEDGDEYYVDGWITEAQSGEKFLNLRFKPKEARVVPAGRRVPSGGREDLDDEDVPF